MKKVVHNRAFSLIEVTIAMGIAAFCLLAIFGLLPVGMNANQTSVRTTYAASLAEALATDLNNTEKGGVSLVYGLAPDSQTGDEQIFLKESGTKVESPAEADYRALVTINRTAAGGVMMPENVRIVVSWPAGAKTPSNSFEAVTTLDRN